MRESVIVITKGETVETYGSIKSVCRVHTKFAYHTIKSKKLPFVYEGWTFTKSKIN